MNWWIILAIVVAIPIGLYSLKYNKHIAARWSSFYWNFSYGWDWHDWYQKNGHFRYKRDDVLYLAQRNAIGWGVDPTVIILDTFQDEQGNDCYRFDLQQVDMDSIAPLTWQDWALKNKTLPDTAKRVWHRDVATSKCNIEMHFKRL